MSYMNGETLATYLKKKELILIDNGLFNEIKLPDKLKPIILAIINLILINPETQLRGGNLRSLEQTLDNYDGASAGCTDEELDVIKCDFWNFLQVARTIAQTDGIIPNDNNKREKEDN
jgi:hypothetical protein